MKKAFIIIAIFSLALSSFAQPQKAFFVVHCDPNETENFPGLEALVDSANYYDIKLTIEFTSFWVDSILPFTARLNKITIWESQGHEIGLHHHGVDASGVWDGFSNLEMIEIHNEGRDTLLYKGTTDSLLNYVQQVTSTQIRVTGTKEITEMPEFVVYQTKGQAQEEAYSNAVTTSWDGKFYCTATHAFLYKAPNTADIITTEYTSSIDYKILGANCHVYNFLDDPTPVITYFKLISENENIESQTVREVMDCECECGSAELEKSNFDIDIYPNPTSETLIINTSKSKFEDYNVSIYQMSGKLVFINDYQDSNIELDLGGLSTGLYTIVINADGKKISKQIIKK